MRSIGLIILLVSLITFEAGCQDDSPMEDPTEIENPHVKLVGAPSEITYDQTIRDKLINNLDQLQDIKLTLVTLEKVTEQIVQGTLYKFTGLFKDENGILSKCVITVWDRPWLDSPDNLILTLVSKENVSENITDEFSEKTTIEETSVDEINGTPENILGGNVVRPPGGGLGGMPGGVSEISPNTDIIDLLKNNLNKIPDVKLTLIRLTKVTQQVVAGMLYTFTGIFLDENQAISNCVISIWEQPWLAEPDNLTIKLISQEKLNRHMKCVGV